MNYLKDFLFKHQFLLQLLQKYYYCNYFRQFYLPIHLHYCNLNLYHHFLYYFNYYINHTQMSSLLYMPNANLHLFFLYFSTHLILNYFFLVITAVSNEIQKKCILLEQTLYCINMTDICNPIICDYILHKFCII